MVICTQTKNKSYGQYSQFPVGRKPAAPDSRPVQKDNDTVGVYDYADANKRKEKKDEKSPGMRNDIYYATVVHKYFLAKPMISAVVVGGTMGGGGVAGNFRYRPCVV